MQQELEKIAHRLETLASEIAAMSHQIRARLSQTTIQPSVAEPGGTAAVADLPAAQVQTFEQLLAGTVAAARAKLTTPELRQLLLAELATLGVARVSEADTDQLKH